MVTGSHPWTLVGPWYRWSSPGVPASGRLSGPIIQKYETSDFINAFLANPQHSLQFLESEDRVFEVTPRIPPLPLFNGRKQSLSANTVVSTGIRKLFLDTHKRFYLVVCELHCDVAGLPSVDRSEVCEAGFVIRRRAVQIPKAAEKPLRNALRKGADATAVQTLATQVGVVPQLQGWIPSPFDRVGSWQKLTDETPAVNIGETIHPLYPLIADPRLAKHAGKGRSIYFGTIPTGAADTDELGNARFDDRNLYEIRCFARRHRPPCPKLLTRNDCHGQLTWSSPAEKYQLASHFDLAGSSNRPVTIQLPDLPSLEAQVAADPALGRKAAVKMISPKGSNLQTSGPLSDLKGNPPGASICSFSIPLITIVASFVFSLFLPIVVFLFQLWWMLALKFCIPPSFSLSANVAAKLAANANADLDVQFAGFVKTDFHTNLDNQAPPGTPPDKLPSALIDAQFSPGAQVSLEAAAAVNLSASLPPDVQVDPSPSEPGYPAGSIPSITANLVFLPEVPLS